MTTLRKELSEYLAMRRALGFKLRNAGTALLNFVAFMEEHGAEYITTNLSLRWAQEPHSAQPATWALRFTYVRVFARYMRAIDERTEVPANNLLTARSTHRQPYLYTDNEIQGLMTAALNLPIYPALTKASIVKRQTYYCLIGLLAVTGMRISEATNLKMKNVDLQNGILTLEGTKFGKTRLLPLHNSTVQVLSQYRTLRCDYLNGGPDDHFFINMVGNRLDYAKLHRTFQALACGAGLKSKDSDKGPRIHDFRHRFAVHTLLNWYRAGEDAERMLPILSTYLGHVHVNDTYWYLTAYPELMGHAVKRLEKRWEDQS